MTDDSGFTRRDLTYFGLNLTWTIFQNLTGSKQDYSPWLKICFYSTWLDLFWLDQLSTVKLLANKILDLTWLDMTWLDLTWLTTTKLVASKTVHRDLKFVFLHLTWRLYLPSLNNLCAIKLLAHCNFKFVFLNVTWLDLTNLKQNYQQSRLLTVTWNWFYSTCFDLLELVLTWTTVYSQTSSKQDCSLRLDVCLLNLT